MSIDNINSPALIRTISYSDDQLIAMIKNKNKKAFEHLYDKYSPALYGSICKQIEDKSLAEEILQQTFLNVWDSLTNAFYQKNHLLLWMMNVAGSITRERTAGENLHPGYKLAAL